MGRQGTVPPLIDVLVHALELVGERLGGHPLAPQQAADVVDLTRADAGQVHADRRLLDALLATPVAFDDRRLEDRALQLRHPERHRPGLHGQVPLVVARTVGPPTGRTLVSRGPGDLVGLKRPASRSTAPRPSGTRDGPASSRACSRRPVESDPAWFVASFHSGFMFGDRNRTPATGHALPTQASAKVRKPSDVIRDAALGRHGRRLLRQRHGRVRRRRVQDRAGLAAQAVPGRGRPGAGDVPMGLMVELEVTPRQLGLQDT